MSLYIRLMTNFWEHRKTMMLFSKIGNDAFWIPPRLWSYAATHQPDGDFSAYNAEGLARLIGYAQSNAQAMLQALQETGFLDEMKIHDWHEHNEFHFIWSNKAKKAADKRWKNHKKRQDKKRQDKTRASIPQSNAQSNAQGIEPKLNEKENAEKQETLSPFKAFLKIWVSEFNATFHEDYLFTNGRDHGAAKQLLKAAGSVDKVMEKAKAGWLSKDAFIAKRCRTIHGLLSEWNSIAQAPPSRNVTPTGVFARPTVSEAA